MMTPAEENRVCELTEEIVRLKKHLTENSARMTNADAFPMSRRTMRMNRLKMSRRWMNPIPSISRRGCIYEPQKRITAQPWKPIFL